MCVKPVSNYKVELTGNNTLPPSHCTEESEAIQVQELTQNRPDWYEPQPSVIIRCKVQRLPASFLITGSHEREHSHPCQASIPTDDTLIHWRHTLAAQEAGQKTAVLEHRRLWGVTAGRSLSSSSVWESRSEWAYAELKPGFGDRSILRAPFRNRRASHQQVEVICLIGGSLFSFRFISDVEWPGFRGTVWVLTLALLLHRWLITAPPCWKHWLPFCMHLRLLTYPSPVLFPQRRTEMKSQNIKCEICC